MVPDRFVSQDTGLGKVRADQFPIFLSLVSFSVPIDRRTFSSHAELCCFFFFCVVFYGEKRVWVFPPVSRNVSTGATFQTPMGRTATYRRETLLLPVISQKVQQCVHHPDHSSSWGPFFLFPPLMCEEIFCSLSKMPSKNLYVSVDFFTVLVGL